MTKAKTFKELIVWQKAVELAKTVYRETETLPAKESFGLQGQMRRAAVAIASNIAEGAKRRTSKDFLNFLHIADGSAAELETQILIAEGAYPHTNFASMKGLLDEVQKMLGAMMRNIDPNLRV